MHAFNPLNYNIKNCAEGRQGGETICTWNFYGRFVGEFLGFPPYDGIIDISGATTFNFNDKGILTKTQDYFNLQELKDKLQGKKNSTKDAAVKSMIDWMNGDGTAIEFQQHVDEDQFKYIWPLGSASLSKFIAGTELFLKAAPDSHIDLYCNPSEEDFDIWLCPFHAVYPFKYDCPKCIIVGKKGVTIEQNGVCVIEFNEIGKMKVVIDIFNLKDIHIHNINK